jgi:hypothetical protein
MPPPLVDTYDGEPKSVASRPLPLESVHVVPDIGAVSKLNCKPEVTIPDGNSGFLRRPKENELLSELNIQIPIVTGL